ncbi:heavy metal-binding domain-containing protein [Methanoregula sp.]
MNYCPVCKREYKEVKGKQTGRCPVCGTDLVQISESEMAVVRRENIRKNE